MKSGRLRILIVQPALLHYRRLVYNALANWCHVDVVANRGDIDAGERQFLLHEVECRSLFGLQWQRSLLRVLRHSNPNAVWLCADVNFVSSLLLLVVCRCRGIKVILHGQGFVKPSRSPLLRLMVVKLWMALANRYASYAPVCTASFRNSGVPTHKISTVNNRLEVSVVSERPTAFSTNPGVLFVGRLRPGCGIRALIDCLSAINADRRDAIQLHVVGDGELASLLQDPGAPPWLTWHGTVTETDQLKSIATSCSIGAYPGSAGLSVLTYMQLGLAVVVARDIAYHMGPEPSFVKDSFNGWTYDHENSKDLERVLRLALGSPQLPLVRRRSFETFQQLHRRSYAEEMAELLMGTCGRNDFQKVGAEVIPADRPEPTHVWNRR